MLAHALLSSAFYEYYKTFFLSVFAPFGAGCFFLVEVFHLVMHAVLPLCLSYTLETRARRSFFERMTVLMHAQ